MTSPAFPRIGTLLNRDPILKIAETIHFSEGETLFTENEPPQYLYLLHSGKCMLSRDARPIGEAQPDEIFDTIAVLGGVAHSQRAIALTDCVFLRWKLDQLWQNVEFSRAARQDLSAALQQAQDRLKQLQAPVRYQPYSAQVYPGPFVFPNSTILFAFCSIQREELNLPAGVSRIGKRLLVGIADFPDAYYHHRPDARFSYTETTFFVPVRVGVRLGLYVPYIYPSAYEPILLGREIYGFPKQLGETRISENHASLSVAGLENLSMRWDTSEKVNEARIVGAFGQLFGITGQITAAAFTIGDTLLNMMHVPFYRRVSVFNHKRIPGTETKQGELTYDVDQLTQAIFSVENWQGIARLPDARISTISGIFPDKRLSLDEAFSTRLTMRLSTGRIVRDYRANS